MSECLRFPIRTAQFRSIADSNRIIQCPDSESQKFSPHNWRSHYIALRVQIQKVVSLLPCKSILAENFWAIYYGQSVFMRCP